MSEFPDRDEHASSPESNTPPFVKEILNRNASLFALDQTSSEFQGRLDAWTGSINSRLSSLRGDSALPPEISIAVPAKDETRYILQLLESIAEQDINKSVEVVVVVNNCTPGDRTAEIAGASGAKVVEYNDPNNPTPISHARQKGLEDAEGEIIVSTDADAIVSPSWLLALTKQLDDPKSTCVTGHVRHYNGTRVLRVHDYGTKLARRASWAAGKVGGKLGVDSDRANVMSFGANMAFRKSDAQKVGGYDLRLPIGEDSALGKELAKIGNAHLIRNEDSQVWVSPRRFSTATAKDYIKGRLRVGGGFGNLYLDQDKKLKDFREENPK